MNLVAPAATAADLRITRQLFEEYARELGVNLSFQNFTRELDTLPGVYVPPGGALLLARVNGEVAGCVALRPAGEDTCEMKRLFVRPAFRRRGVAKSLVAEILAAAERAGYRSMVLDTLDWMKPAAALYESFGFRRTAPYYANPLPGVVYLRRALLPVPAGFTVRPATNADAELMPRGESRPGDC